MGTGRGREPSDLLTPADLLTRVEARSDANLTNVADAGYLPQSQQLIGGQLGIEAHHTQGVPGIAVP